MYVCICNAITERDINAAVADGCRSLRELNVQLGVGRDCGRCCGCARDLLKDCLGDGAPRSMHASGQMAAI